MCSGLELARKLGAVQVRMSGTVKGRFGERRVTQHSAHHNQRGAAITFEGGALDDVVQFGSRRSTSRKAANAASARMARRRIHDLRIRLPPDRTRWRPR